MNLEKNIDKQQDNDLEYHFVKKDSEPPAFALGDPWLLADLKKESCLIITRGQKSCGGYSIDLENSFQGGDHISIWLKTSDPKPGSLNIALINRPWVYIKTGAAKTYSVTLNGNLIIEDRNLA